MVRTVIVGSGDIARKRHIPGILRAEHGQLRGFYNRHWERSQEAARQYGGVAYETYEEVLADADVDAVLIAVPTPAHRELVLRALAAGKHVLCEKPMAVNAQEAAEMAKAAEAAGRKLMVCFVQRLYEPCVKARELIADGQIGRVLSFRTFLGVKGGAVAKTSAAEPWKNAVAELGSHRIDLMRYLLGAEASRVFCRLAVLDAEKPDAAVVSGEDNAMAILEYENGVLGMMAFSRTSYGGNDRTTTIFGTEGVLTIYGETGALRLARKDGRVEEYPFPFEEQSRLEITAIHELFFRCIEEDTEPPMSGWDGWMAAATVDAMRESDRSGSWGALPKRE